MTLREHVKLAILRLCYEPFAGFGNRIKVLSGPFAGMTYVSRSIGSAIAPKVLGTYEKELYAVLTEILKIRFKTIINIGAGEGYYAVGLARTHSDRPRIVAFESEEKSRKLLSRMAELNHTSNISVSGKCEVSDLSSALSDSRPALVICDAEGYEHELLVPDAIPELAHAWILVEVHEFIQRGIRERIVERFRATHVITEIESKVRQSGDFPLHPKLPRGIAVRLMSEHRPEAMSWLWMVPASGKSPGK